jgi:hypothetical protein
MSQLEKKKSIREYLSEEELKQEVIALKEDKTRSKERFGEMILLLVYNILRMPSFSGYTDDYKQDMISAAINRIFKYYDRYDQHKISERTGKPIKTFAYFTEITVRAFWSVLGEKKREQEKMNRFMSLGDLYETAEKQRKSYIEFNTRKRLLEEEKKVKKYVQFDDLESFLPEKNDIIICVVSDDWVLNESTFQELRDKYEGYDFSIIRKETEMKMKEADNKPSIEPEEADVIDEALFGIDAWFGEKE